MAPSYGDHDWETAKDVLLAHEIQDWLTQNATETGTYDVAILSQRYRGIDEGDLRQFIIDHLPNEYYDYFSDTVDAEGVATLDSFLLKE